ALTLRPKAGAPDRWDDIALRSLAEELRGEIAKVEDVGLTYLVGGRPAQLRIEPDPDRLALMGVTLNQLVDKLRDANRAFLAGAVRDRGEHLPAVAGRTFAGPSEIELLLLTTRDGRPVYVKDVADVVMSGRPDEVMVLDLRPDGHGQLTDTPAVTVAIAKRKGANAIAVAETALARLEALRTRLIPADIDVTVTRDYGETAKDKADELLFHLVLASVTIVALLTLALGWREGLVVLVAIPTTILLTFLAALLMGYTINRVSLFALIFSIGILVDDAIVVVENIARHWREKGLADAVNRAAEAVDEVGNPTIVATFTIVVALLPMMFVSGLMGPYMSPIPANASAAMVFSLAVAFTMAPWLMRRLAPRRASAPDAAHEGEGRLGALYRRIATPLLASPARARDFLIAALAVTILSLGLFATKTVVVKLLPFDDKSELQVVVDLPPGTSLEATARLLGDAARRLASLPELDHIQLYAGTAAPFNFNGLVRHSYLRDKPHQGELQVNLAPKGKRERNSHAVALEVRGRLAGLALP
ncbi:MAG: efflux RND transporter permease subunit, partial [Alphaproteobacteria bacterium]|nr:efflux RND transporter permease subunit [Alphaproteobacteria bacterium]